MNFKQKKILLSIFTASSLYASSNISLEERISKLEALIEQQQQIINELKSSKNNKINENRLDKLVQKVEKLESNKEETTLITSDIEERLDQIETRSYTDKIALGLGFKTRVDNFHIKTADNQSYNDNEIFSTKFQINLQSIIDQYFIFHGRLSMYKYWADSSVHPYAEFDSMQGRAPSDSSVYVERAYIDWLLNEQHSYIPVILTIGRQPSSDGPSYQYSDNTSRKSTYSALVFDGASDGIVATLNLSKALNMEKSYLRFAYGKGFQDSNANPTATNPYIGVDSNGLKDNDVYGIFFESKIPSISNSFYQVGFTKAANIVADARSSNITNKNLGDIDFLGAMVELTNFNNSQIDFFAHAGWSKAKPNGKTYTYDIDTNQDGVTDTTTSAGLLSNDGLNEYDGYAYWLGSRYTFDQWQFGLEYNTGSKNWISINQGARDTYGKLSTRGDAYELYINKMFGKYTTLKLGYVNIDYKYTNSGWYLGEPEAIESSIMNASATPDELSNIYLQMQLLF